MPRPYPRIRRFGSVMPSPPKVHTPIRRPNRANSPRPLREPGLRDSKLGPLPPPLPPNGLCDPCATASWNKVDANGLGRPSLLMGVILWNQACMGGGSSGEAAGSAGLTPLGGAIRGSAERSVPGEVLPLEYFDEIRLGRTLGVSSVRPTRALAPWATATTAQPLYPADHFFTGCSLPTKCRFVSSIFDTFGQVIGCLRPVMVAPKYRVAYTARQGRPDLHFG